MSVSQLSPPPHTTDTAVLLVLLPVCLAGQPQQLRLQVLLDYLQRRLSPAIRVLKIDEATHPAVVHSFHAQQLPACVLVRQGVELWRQQGLPDAEDEVALLLNKLTQN
ncbi:thioredoxin [Hymenobacter sp. BT507]|uniref:Thioredoxin n=1 Tax=Hymenobacter citatus TaxID=2763506 RepID=A0ABR7MN66_9BACT|nr:thioredoxin [Hymenobacter citatus]MBC6612532.1 thioredoxin [Hymenobacter citatus]